MTKRHFTIREFLIVIAAIALEFGVLPIPVAVFAACVTMLVPLAVFLMLQRTFVRGILAGSVK